MLGERRGTAPGGVRSSSKTSRLLHPGMKPGSELASQRIIKARALHPGLDHRGMEMPRNPPVPAQVTSPSSTLQPQRLQQCGRQPGENVPPMTAGTKTLRVSIAASGRNLGKFQCFRTHSCPSASWMPHPHHHWRPPNASSAGCCERAASPRPQRGE